MWYMLWTLPGLLLLVATLYTCATWRPSTQTFSWLATGVTLFFSFALVCLLAYATWAPLRLAQTTVWQGTDELSSFAGMVDSYARHGEPVLTLLQRYNERVVVPLSLLEQELLSNTTTLNATLLDAEARPLLLHLLGFQTAVAENFVTDLSEHTEFVYDIETLVNGTLYDVSETLAKLQRTLSPWRIVFVLVCMAWVVGVVWVSLYTQKAVYAYLATWIVLSLLIAVAVPAMDPMYDLCQDQIAEYRAKYPLINACLSRQPLVSFGYGNFTIALDTHAVIYNETSPELYNATELALSDLTLVAALAYAIESETAQLVDHARCSKDLTDQLERIADVPRRIRESVLTLSVVLWIYAAITMYCILELPATRSYAPVPGQQQMRRVVPRG